MSRARAKASGSSLSALPKFRSSDVLETIGYVTEILASTTEYPTLRSIAAPHMRMMRTPCVIQASMDGGSRGSRTIVAWLQGGHSSRAGQTIVDLTSPAVHLTKGKQYKFRLERLPDNSFSVIDAIRLPDPFRAALIKGPNKLVAPSCLYCDSPPRRFLGRWFKALEIPAARFSQSFVDLSTKTFMKTKAFNLDHMTELVKRAATQKWAFSGLVKFDSFWPVSDPQNPGEVLADSGIDHLDGLNANGLPANGIRIGWTAGDLTQVGSNEFVRATTRITFSDGSGQGGGGFQPIGGSPAFVRTCALNKAVGKIGVPEIIMARTMVRDPDQAAYAELKKIDPTKFEWNNSSTAETKKKSMNFLWVAAHEWGGILGFRWLPTLQSVQENPPSCTCKGTSKAVTQYAINFIAPDVDPINSWDVKFQSLGAQDLEMSNILYSANDPPSPGTVEC